MKEKIGFKNLTIPLQILVTLAWIGVGFGVFSFMIGFFWGITGTL